MAREPIPSANKHEERRFEQRLRWRHEALNAVARAVREGFTSDPGTADLDDEQPINVSMTLGDWRKAVQLQIFTGDREKFHDGALAVQPRAAE